MKALHWSLLFVFALTASSSPAAPVIQFSDVELRVGEMKSFQVNVVGGDAIQGLNLVFQIGDGGAIIGGKDTKPIISSIDLITGTIFEGNNTGQTVVFGDPGLIQSHSITTSTGTVSANGVLATVTLDGRSLTLADAGTTVSYGLASPGFATTDFAGIPATLEGTNGTLSNITITAIPEPSSIFVIGLVGAATVITRRRRR